MAKKVLGKGLGAIISDSVSLDALEKTLAEEKERVVLINVEKIKPNPNQPRTHIDDSAIRTCRFYTISGTPSANSRQKRGG
jgi:ParB family chromosome partitioning protein